MNIVVKQRGSFKKINTWLEKTKEAINSGILDKYGKEGVAALSAATPKESGLTAKSWYYEIEHRKDGASIIFSNSNIQNGYHIAILLQYGHGTGTGGWVEGKDYINPAIRPVMETLADDLWKEVKKL